MAGLEDLIGTFAGASQPFSDAGSPSAGLSTAATSTPMDYRALLGPILESVAAEARRKADPINRLYDIGGAIHDAVATGGSFQKSMLAADQARQSSIAGAGNMFLNMLSQERQAKALENESAYRTATLAQGEERLKLQARDQWDPVTIGEGPLSKVMGLRNKYTGAIVKFGPNGPEPYSGPVSTSPGATPASTSPRSTVPGISTPASK